MDGVDRLALQVKELAKLLGMADENTHRTPGVFSGTPTNMISLILHPAAPNEPHSAHAARLISYIFRKSGTTPEQVKLSHDVRKFSFNIKPDKANVIADEICNIRAYLTTHPKQQAAIKNLLINAARIETQFHDPAMFDGESDASYTTKTSPRFTLEKLNNDESQPVLGLKITTNDPCLVKTLNKIATLTPSIKVKANVTFQRNDIPAIPHAVLDEKKRKIFTGSEFTAQGTSLPVLLKVALKDRKTLEQELAAQSHAPATPAKPGQGR